MHPCKELRASAEEAADDRWTSHLGRDPLRLILNRLPAIDHLRFESVCKSWLSIAGERSVRCARQVPWLRVTTAPRSEWLRLPEEDGGAICPIMGLGAPDEFQGWKCCGVSDGWMILFSIPGHRMALVNPISKARLPSFPLPDSRLLCLFFHVAYWKAVLSSAPTSTDCVLVFVATGSLRPPRIYTCRVGGDGGWKESLSDGFPNRISDLRFHKGRLYLLDLSSHLTVFHCDPLHLRLTKLEAIIPPELQIPRGLCKYLIESGGDLLQVVLELESYMEWSTEHHRPIYRCYVFKLDTGCGSKWVETKSLGDNMLFVGNMRSESISSSEGLSLRANSIYFVCLSGYFVIGFSMEDESLQMIPIPGSTSDLGNELDWFMPQVV